MKKKLFSSIFACMLIFAACSSDSSSSSPESNTNPSNEEINNTNNEETPSTITNASQCDLATTKLPASTLAWQSTFAGGCEVTQAFALEELQSFDQQLIALGYIKNALTQESYIYSLNKNDFDNLMVYNDTLRFTYATGFFSGNFDASERPMSESEVQTIAILEACSSLLPENFFETDICSNVAKSGQEWTGTKSIKYNTESALVQALAGLGWSCTTKAAFGSTTDFTCSATFEGKSYTLTANTNNSGALLKLNIKYKGKV